MRVKASFTQAEGRSLRGAGSGLACPIAGGEYLEHTCWDPKDGELCLARMKPEETLVEVRSDSDANRSPELGIGRRLIEPSSSWFLRSFLRIAGARHGVSSGKAND
ncbi:unnamed protein product [Meganyctiphanes norvegica]|uniref:Uncharacterized protein n=1 Tax=Meganyctiphanes norvegica TaxID=48144 RepID=A0AAV2RNJ0_MEGNR